MSASSPVQPNSRPTNIAVDIACKEYFSPSVLWHGNKVLAILTATSWLTVITPIVMACIQKANEANTSSPPLNGRVGTIAGQLAPKNQIKEMKERIKSEEDFTIAGNRYRSYTEANGITIVLDEKQADGKIKASMIKFTLSPEGEVSVFDEGVKVQPENMEKFSKILSNAYNAKPYFQAFFQDAKLNIQRNAEKEFTRDNFTYKPYADPNGVSFAVNDGSTTMWLHFVQKGDKVNIYQDGIEVPIDKQGDCYKHLKIVADHLPSSTPRVSPVNNASIQQIGLNQLNTRPQDQNPSTSSEVHTPVHSTPPEPESVSNPNQPDSQQSVTAQRPLPFNLNKEQVLSEIDILNVYFPNKGEGTSFQEYCVSQLGADYGTRGVAQSEITRVITKFTSKILNDMNVDHPKTNPPSGTSFTEYFATKRFSEGALPSAHLMAVQEFIHEKTKTVVFNSDENFYTLLLRKYNGSPTIMQLNFEIKKFENEHGQPISIL